jgi:hypothetical protein
MQGMRDRVSHATTETGRRIGSAMRGLTDDEEHPDDARLARLERLGELKDKGVLTPDEFQAEKQKLLTG